MLRWAPSPVPSIKVGYTKLHVSLEIKAIIITLAKNMALLASRNIS